MICSLSVLLSLGGSIIVGDIPQYKVVFRCCVCDDSITTRGTIDGLTGAFWAPYTWYSVMLNIDVIDHNRVLCNKCFDKKFK